MRDARLLDVFA